MTKSRKGRDESYWQDLLPPAIAVVGKDRLILEDVTRFGLHRRHVVCFAGLPDPSWIMTAPKDADVNAWSYTDEIGIGHLWICWKEK
jgi:hypothetical protein